MQTQASTDTIRILAYSKEEAMRTGDYAISTDHLLLGILRHKDNEACRALQELGIDVDDLKSYVEKKLFRPRSLSFDDENKMLFSRSAKNTLNLSILEANIAASERVLPVHLLLAICASSESHSLSYLKGRGLDHAAIKAYLKEKGTLKATVVKKDGAAQSSPVSILKIISSPDKIAS